MTAFSIEMLQRRLCIRQAMAQQHLGGLLVYANQIHPQLIHYAAGHMLLSQEAYAYLPMEDDRLYLFISDGLDLERATAECVSTQVLLMDDTFFRELDALHQKHGGMLGIAGREHMTRLSIRALETAIGKQTVPATGLLENLATIKSDYELNLIRQAAKMADAGFEKAVASVQKGLSDHVLGAEINLMIREMGATDNFQLLVVGKQNTGMLLPRGAKVERGDLLLFEITPSVGSTTYSAQICKTAIFGQPPDPVLQAKYAVLSEALEQSLTAIKPGVEIGEITRIQDQVLSQAGYGDYCRPPYMQQRGHGFGLGAIKLTADNTRTFEAGMSFVVHPNQFLPETGYLALGEHIIVTDVGMERLTRTEPKIYQCAHS